LQPLLILSRWAIWYCFAELIGDASTALFHRQLDLFLQAQHIGTKGDLQAHRRLANRARRSSGLYFFVLFIRFIPSSQFKKDVSNNATQDTTMNVHNKTQLTHARINCILKDLSCYTPLSKILKLTILASNTSLSSTKFTQDQKGLLKACNGAECKGLSTLEQKAISRPIGDSPTGLDDLQAFISAFFSSALFLLAK
ncbi:hypothetical protein H5410_062115, partial [Solanum commersonii]